MGGRRRGAARKKKEGERAESKVKGGGGEVSLKGRKTRQKDEKQGRARKEDSYDGGKR